MRKRKREKEYKHNTWRHFDINSQTKRYDFVYYKKVIKTEIVFYVVHIYTLLESPI